MIFRENIRPEWEDRTIPSLLRSGNVCEEGRVRRCQGKSMEKQYLIGGFKHFLFFNQFSNIFQPDIHKRAQDKMNTNGGHFQFQLKPTVGGGQVDEYWNNLVLGVRLCPHVEINFDGEIQILCHFATKHL